MTAKELLTPRFEVINIYPNTLLKIGEILTPINDKEIHYDCTTNNLCNLVVKPEEYPHLFRKLNWWEHRQKEDMPKRLKSLALKDNPDFDIEKEEVFNILEWNMKNLDGIIDYEKRQVCSLTMWCPDYGYIPVE